MGMLISRRRAGACVALRWDTGEHRYRCGVVTDTAGVLGTGLQWLAPMTRRLALRWISAGSGCDADLDVGTPSAPPKA